MMAKDTRKWYFWVSVLDGVVGPFNNKREARKYVREHVSVYQRRHAFYMKLEPQQGQVQKHEKEKPDGTGT